MAYSGRAVRDFLRAKNGQRTVFLEFGVGYNTAGIIKYPFWRPTADRRDAQFVCINYGDAYAPEEIQEKSICINEDVGSIIKLL